MSDCNRELERSKTNRLLEELYALKKSEIEDMSPQECLTLDILISLKKIEHYMETVVGYKLE